MNNLYIDYERCINIGNDIKKDYIRLNELLNKLNEFNTNEELTNDLKEIIKLSEIIDVTGDFLVNVSNAYKNVENAGVTKVE